MAYKLRNLNIVTIIILFILRYHLILLGTSLLPWNVFEAQYNINFITSIIEFKMLPWWVEFLIQIQGEVFGNVYI